MESRKFKKYVALAMATILAFSLNMVALAAGGSSTGDGEFEGSVQTDVFEVEVPTSAAEGTYDFILDPENLIKQSIENGQAKDDYTEEKFPNAYSMYFANVSGNSVSVNGTYTNTSDPIKAVNKGSTDVDVKITAELTELEGITVTDDKTFADDTSASIYLAIKDTAATPNEVAMDEEGSATLTASMEGTDESNFQVVYDSTNDKYVYELKDDVDESEFSTYEFRLTGAANTAGDWSADGIVAGSVEVTWDFSQHSDSVAFATLMYNASSDRIVFRPVAGENVVASKLTSVTVDGASKTFVVSSQGSVTVSGSPTVGTHEVVAVYDGQTYKGTVTR